jgi:hypothetical protein
MKNLSNNNQCQNNRNNKTTAKLYNGNQQENNNRHHSHHIFDTYHVMIYTEDLEWCTTPFYDAQLRLQDQWVSTDKLLAKRVSNRDENKHVVSNMLLCSSLVSCASILKISTILDHWFKSYGSWK